MLKVCVLGATGLVGQRFIQCLWGHPWFRLTGVLASERSAGKRYGEVGKWCLDREMPPAVRRMKVGKVGDLEVDADVVFSALPADVAREVEPRYAAAGYTVCSNASAYRMEEDVPLLIPEVNPDHLGLLEAQRKRRRWKGALITNPNCTTVFLAMALAPLRPFGIEEVAVSTMQALSGAGYGGVPGMAIADNVLPYIGKEEEKVESEPRKILGTLRNGRVQPAGFDIRASCHRVPVIDGHTESILVRLSGKPSLDRVRRAWESFESIGTPTAPERPIVVRDEMDRPQPRMDRDAGRGMTVSVGRVARKGPWLRLLALGHNTIRGAAGASVLNAELMVNQGYLKR
ncbi:MAG: aspartate-semialdehyde dehydrogenase [Euryarchaeota archaeon]|nr:aspartate-semialdehyde dehydrogenase [Euryarchaeota archaeon]